MQYIGSYLPNWVTKAVTKGNSNEGMNNNNTNKNTSSTKKKGSTNGAGSGSAGLSRNYQEAMSNVVSEESIRQMIASAEKGTNQMQTTTTTSVSQNNEIAQNFQAQAKCTEILNKYGIYSGDVYTRFVDSNESNKLYSPGRAVPDEEMKKIGMCAKWFFGGVDLHQQNVANALARVRGAEGLARQQAAQKQAAAQEYYRSAQQALTARFGTGYGGRRKNKTKRSKKTKRQTRRR